MTDSLAQADAIVLLASGITIVADVVLVGDTIEAAHIKRDMDLIRVRPSNWGGADWAQIR
jgi:alpha-D-ribose 1-methylphosphonate 5-triphosphate diphosphatase PhnM